MAVMAKWGDKRWQVTANTLNPIDNLSYSLEWNSDEGRKEPKTITVPYTVYAELGIDVKKEIDNWDGLLGKRYALYLGEQRFGPRTVKLMSANVSDIKITENGIIRSASISLSFEE